MRNGTKATDKIPAAPLIIQPIDPEVVEFREAFEGAKHARRKHPRRCPKKRSRRPIETEVDDFVAQHAGRRG